MIPDGVSRAFLNRRSYRPNFVTYEIRCYTFSLIASKTSHPASTPSWVIRLLIHISLLEGHLTQQPATGRLGFDGSHFMEISSEKFRALDEVGSVQLLVRRTKKSGH